MGPKRHAASLALSFLFTAALLAPAGALAGTIAQSDKTTEGSAQLRAMFDGRRKTEIDGSRSVTVENLVIQKDITKITLVSGTIWFSKPWKEGAKPTGAWFSGQGRIQMTPPVTVEKEPFKDAMNSDALDEKFTQGFMRFNDDFYDLLKDKLAASTTGGDAAASSFRERQKSLEDIQAWYGVDLEFPLLADSLSEGPRSTYFLFEFEMAKQGWIGFMHAPAGVPFGLLGESLYFRAKRVTPGDSPIITVFHDKAEYDSGRDLGHEDRDSIWIRSYKGEIKVDKDGLLLKPKFDMEIEAMADGVNVLPMALLSYWGDETHPFSIGVVADSAGKPLDFIHRADNLLVVLPKAMKKGEKTTVHIEYTADYIRPDPAFAEDIPPQASPEVRGALSKLAGDYATFTLLNTYPWFPQSGYNKRHTLDWVVKVPFPYLPVASGVTEKRWRDDDGYNCLHSVETTPVVLASIIFGRYYMATDASVRPTINVYALGKQQKAAGDISAEARTVVTAYEKWFGTFPYGELDIAEMAFGKGFGQAPPGLVQLTGEAFLSGADLQAILQLFEGGSDPSFVHAFIAHETGHEWWGHAVSWANENDQWLSESFTEYCSGLYVQATISQKSFDAKRREWRDVASTTKDAGAIWLGGSRLGKHYTAQIYDKGPLVLHMLRLALQAQAVANGGAVADGDKMFFDSLHNFIEQNRNQNATTKDLQKTIKATAKVDMDWFFDQWFYGNHWMNITFKYEVRPTEDGKFLLVATFKQDKDRVKMMTVPMDIHIGGKTITKMVFVNKPEQVVQLKLPVTPEKVTLDDNQDVLADIKYE